MRSSLRRSGLGLYLREIARDAGGAVQLHLLPRFFDVAVFGAVDLLRYRPPLQKIGRGALIREALREVDLVRLGWERPSAEPFDGLFGRDVRMNDNVSSSPNSLTSSSLRITGILVWILPYISGQALVVQMLKVRIVVLSTSPTATSL